MVNDMTDISALIERVKAATGPDARLDVDLATLSGWKWNVMEGSLGYWTDPEGDQRGIPNYTASIDAALALVERVLPGWVWNVGKCHPEFLTEKDKPVGAEIMGPVSWKVFEREVGEEPVFDTFHATAMTAPLAILLALLLALKDN